MLKMVLKCFGVLLLFVLVLYSFVVEKPKWSILPNTVLGPALIGRGVTMLNDGRVYMAGGAQYGSPVVYTDYAQIYDPVLKSYVATKPLPFGRYNAEAQTLPSGDVLIFGGYSAEQGYLADCLIYHVSSDTFSAANPMPFITQSHTSVSLRDGTLLSFGGSSHGILALAKVAQYDESSGHWTQLPDMPFSSSYMASSLMVDGQVLLVGGRDESGYRNQTYKYNPDTGIYAQVDNAPIAMRGGFLETLSAGLIVYGGGEYHKNTYSQNTYFYNIANNEWLTAEKLPYKTAFADSIKLSNGNIVLFGGNTETGKGQRVYSLIRYAD